MLSIDHWDDHWESFVQRSARRQTIPGFEADDVANEMRWTIWEASKTYRPEKGDFGKYWWSCWVNRRINYLESFYAKKRPKIANISVPDTGYFDQLAIPKCPVHDALSQAIWIKLALGDTPTEVQRDLRISRRRYYSTIQRLREDAEVRSLLSLSNRYR